MAKKRIPSEYVYFDSFNKLKRYLGDAGKEFAWHHIVEQSQTGKRANFAPELIHNTYNIVRIPSGHNSIHAKISAFYSSKQDFTGGIIVRDWLATKDYDYQYDFGIKILEQYGKLIPTNNGWTFKRS